MNVINSINTDDVSYVIKKINFNGVNYQFGTPNNTLLLELITGASVNGGGRINGYIDTSVFNISTQSLHDIFNACQHNNYFGGASRENINTFTSLISKNIKFSILISYGTNNPTVIEIKKNEEILFSHSYTADSSVLPILGYQRSDFVEIGSNINIDDVISIYISGNWAGTAVRIFEL